MTSENSQRKRLMCDRPVCPPRIHKFQCQVFYGLAGQRAKLINQSLLIWLA